MNKRMNYAPHQLQYKQNNKTKLQKKLKKCLIEINENKKQKQEFLVRTDSRSFN